jgi:aldehyde:ferredoxin oxidoreductase
MKPTVTHVSHFPSLHGWTNRILRVDLSSHRAWTTETAPMAPDYLGARGLAARIVWDECPEPVDPFDPANPLMVMPGALTGTISAYSGRTVICTFSPQAWPYHWFTRSSIGGHFGGELKRAGYDGLIVTGASNSPARILIRDDEVSILPADDLWGQDVFDTLEALESAEGKGARSLVIGPAGERLSRIATIMTATSSAAGQGGFGAVMGSKRLKAVTVLGSGQVSLANHERVAEITRAVGEEARATRDVRSGVQHVNERLAAEGGGSARPYACTESCVSPCNYFYSDVPGSVQNCRWRGHWTCVGGLLGGMSEQGPISHGGVFDWRQGTRKGLELNVLSNRYGLNQWDMIIGMVPWLEACQRAGLVSELNGVPIDWRSNKFWSAFLHALAYREGTGDALAEGGWAAARILGLGEDLVRRYYTGWGYAGHWDGHGDWANYIVFPFWLVSVFQWLTDTRDPIPSDHSGTWYSMRWGPFGQGPNTPPDKAITWDHMRAISQRLYGTPAVFDPHSGYEAKGYAGFFHTRRAIIKDCLPVDDFVFPMFFSPNTPDRFCRVAGIDGPSLEYHLFAAGTGTPWDEAEFERAADRVYALERAITVRHWGRNRAMDELVIPSYEYKENWASPALGERHALQRESVMPEIDSYYRHLGWDVSTGWPTKERLEALGLGEVYDPMVDGAQRAQETLPAPPEEAPVPEIDQTQPA